MGKRGRRKGRMLTHSEIIELRKQGYTQVSLSLESGLSIEKIVKILGEGLDDRQRTIQKNRRQII